MGDHADIDHTGLTGVGASGAVTSSGLTMATARILGRTTASTGAVEEITVGTGLSLSAGALTATGSGGLTHSYGGYNTVGGSTQTPTANRFYMKKVTVAAAGIITSIGFYFNMGNGNTPIIGAAVLSDSAGAPVAMLAQSGPTITTIGSTAGGAGWRHIPIGLYVTAADYWIGFYINQAAGTMYYDTSATDSYYTSGGAWIGDAFYSVTADTNKRYSLRYSFIA